jgi:integrase
VPRTAKLWRHATRPGWWATIAGKKVNCGLNYDDALKRFHSLKAASRPVARSQIPVEDLVDEYLDAVFTDVLAATHANYRWYLQKWVEFAGSRIASTLKPLDVTAWLKTQVPRTRRRQGGKRETETQGWNASSRRTAVELVKRWSRWCKVQGYLDVDPLADTKKPKAPPRPGPQEGSVEKFLDAVTDPLLADIAIVLCDTGARPSEIRTLTGSQVNWDAATAKVHGKSGLREISLTDRSMEILDRLAKKWPEGPLFRNRDDRIWTKGTLNKRFRVICKNAGIRVLPYHFRHNLWSRASKAGVSDLVIARQLGHANLKMLHQTYAHVTPDMTKEAVELAAKASSPARAKRRPVA